jgi:polyisoprenoid-binding protein YceI
MSTYTIDGAHSRIGFAVKHMVISTVRGKFNEFTSTVTVNEEQPEEAQIEVQINADSVDTSVQMRDDDLRSVNFFDVANYPSISFKSTQIEPLGGSEYRIVGDLTIHGTTKSIAVTGVVEGPTKDPWGNDRVGVELVGRLNRKEFGLTYSAALETGGLVVADEVRLEIDAEYTKVPVGAAATQA